MSHCYRVSIPIEGSAQDGVDFSITHKLEDGLVLGNILRVRVEGTVTYLDIEVVAEQRNEAITSALVMAWRLVQLISLVYNKGFEVSLAGIQAIPIEPAEPPFEIREEENGVHLIVREKLYVSDHIRITEHISSLDPLLPLWEYLNRSDSVVTDGLEWLYLGNIASNDRMAFLAYWLAFELLVERTPGNEQATPVLKKYVLDQQDRTSLKQEMRQVLKKYISDEDAISRLMEYLEQAKVESDIDQDKDMILALKKYEPISTKFEELFDTDACFRSYATLFSQFWPIFEVKSTRHVHYEGDDDREKIIKLYFDSGATVYSPQCWKRHKTQGSKIPVDWPHMLDALYRVRCNLFHGEKALSSENDKRIVLYAAHTLVYFLQGSNYLEL